MNSSADASHPREDEAGTGDSPPKSPDDASLIKDDGEPDPDAGPTATAEQVDQDSERDQAEG